MTLLQLLGVTFLFLCMLVGIVLVLCVLVVVGVLLVGIVGSILKDLLERAWEHLRAVFEVTP